ncbi:VanZ family protein (plasmid) [Haloimpatiens sp. FM7330]|uniref:VanZ family protein n=1 Tax=Haloimpatiens sp. FM7330 TaxID=3298610 RepID=UPI00362872D2
MYNIKKYAEEIVNTLDVTEKQKSDFKIQFINDLNSLKDEYVNDGYSENKSIKLAIKNFENQKNISSNFNFETYSYNKKIKNLLITFLIIYIVALIFICINPRRNISQWVAIARLNGGYLGVTINIIPFKTIIEYIVSFNKNNISVFLLNIFGKIFMFIPLGMLLPFYSKKYTNFRNIIKIVLCISFFIEIIKLILPLGVSDIDHIILSVIGSYVGLLLYKSILKFMKKHNKYVNYDTNKR